MTAVKETLGNWMAVCTAFSCKDRPFGFEQDPPTAAASLC